MKPKRHKHFSAGNKYANSLHCRLRVGRIFFNSHGFAIILTTSDKCSFCNKAETVKHYFFSCSKFKDQQKTLFSSILQIFPEFANKSIENKLQVHYRTVWCGHISVEFLPVYQIIMYCVIHILKVLKYFLNN